MWTQALRESLDMWRRPRKHLQSGCVKCGRWSRRSAKRPLLSAPSANGAAHCSFVIWFGKKTQAKMNWPHPLWSIRGYVCLSIFQMTGGCSPPFWGYLLLPCRHQKWPQTSKCRVPTSPQGGDSCIGVWELACFHTADCFYRGGSSGQRETGAAIPDTVPSGGSV